MKRWPAVTRPARWSGVTTWRRLHWWMFATVSDALERLGDGEHHDDHDGGPHGQRHQQAARGRQDPAADHGQADAELVAAQRASIAPDTAPTPPAAKISPIVAGPSPSSRVAYST